MADGAAGGLARGSRPDVVHAHFWMSGLAVLAAAGDAGRADRADLPRAGQRQAPAPGQRGHQPGRADRGRAPAGPRRRPDRRHLQRRGLRAGPARCAAAPDPGGPVRGGHRRVRPGRPGPAARCDGPGWSASGGWSGARASTRRSSRWPRCPDAELVVAGGSGADDPDRRRLAALAAEHRVADRVRFVGAAAPGAGPGAAALGRRRWSACRGTNRSAWCRWRRWPAAGRWSPARWAGWPTPSWTGSPGCTCRPVDRASWPPAMRGLLDVAHAEQRLRRGRAGPGGRPATAGTGSPRPPPMSYEQVVVARCGRQGGPVTPPRGRSPPTEPWSTTSTGWPRPCRRCGPRPGRWPAGARCWPTGCWPAAGCWPQATAAAPPRPST